MQHHTADEVRLIITAIVSGGGGIWVQRAFTDFARSIPSLPANAGFWAQWGHNFLTRLTGHDISANPPKI